MESFGIQVSQECGEPRRVRINALVRQKAISRDAKQMEQNSRFNDKAVGSQK